MAQLSMKELLESGVHFGHQTRRWNPKMKPYIYGARNGIHIIDLHQTIKMFEDALNRVQRIVLDGGTLLFVGTKKQAQEAVRDAAVQCGQYYISERWLGGLLTNWKTIQLRVARLKELDRMDAEGFLDRLPKKEALRRRQERDELERFLGGIRNMDRMPTAMFVVDLNKESIAVKEAQKMGIEIIALADTNVDPSVADVIIPGNDDAIRAIKLVADKIAEVVLEVRPDLATGGKGEGEEGETSTAALDAADEFQTPVDAELLKAFGNEEYTLTSAPIAPAAPETATTETEEPSNG